MLINHDHKFGIYNRKPTREVYFAKSIKGMSVKRRCLLINDVFKINKNIIIR